MRSPLFVLGPRIDDLQRVGEGLERLGLGTLHPLTPIDAPSSRAAGSFHQLNRTLLHLFGLSPEARHHVDFSTLPPAIAEWFVEEARRRLRDGESGHCIIASNELVLTLPFWRTALRPPAWILVLRGGARRSASGGCCVIDPESDKEKTGEALSELSAALRKGIESADPAPEPFELNDEGLRMILSGPAAGAADSPVDESMQQLYESLDLAAAPAEGAEFQTGNGVSENTARAGFDWIVALDVARRTNDETRGFEEALGRALEEREARMRALRAEILHQAHVLDKRPRAFTRLRRREQELEDDLNVERAWRRELQRDSTFRMFARLSGKGAWLGEPVVKAAVDPKNPYFPPVSRRSKSRDIAKQERGLDELRRGIWNEPWPWPTAEEDRLLAPSPREVKLWFDIRKALRTRSLFSVVVPIHRIEPEILRATLQSVFDQVYERWELCAAVDAAVGPESRRVLEAFRERFPDRMRITEVEGAPGIAVSTNRAAEAADGDFVVLLDHDDRLAPDALLQMVQYLEAHPEADLIYSDEDCIDETGTPGLILRKPDFSPELLLSCNYIIHVVCLRRTLFEDIGRFHEGIECSQDYDLLLRATERARHVGHLTQTLYHWRMHEDSTTHDPLRRERRAREASRKALQDAVIRRGWSAGVEPSRHRDAYRVKFAVDPAARVSIIIPAPDDVMALRRCVRSIRLKSDFRNFELFVVVRPETEPAVVEWVEQGDRERLLHGIRYEGGTAGALFNAAARQCDSPYTLFLDGRTEMMLEEGISAMLEHAQREGIGAVGGQMVTPGRLVQHAGLYLDRDGRPRSAFQQRPADHPGPFNMNHNVRNCLAVSQDCMMMQREVFLEAGGFDEGFTSEFHDIDLCLRLGQAGRRQVYTPFAQFVLDEFGGQGVDAHGASDPDADRDLERFRLRWGEALFRDPYFVAGMESGSVGAGVS